jgi:hypothetical protein
MTGIHRRLRRGKQGLATEFLKDHFIKQLGRPRRGWYDNVKINLMKVGCGVRK